MNVNKSQPSHYLSMNGLVFDVLPLHVKVLLIYAFLCIDNTKKVITVFLFSVYNYLIKVLFTHLNLPTWKYIKECTFYSFLPYLFIAEVKYSHLNVMIKNY